MQQLRLMPLFEQPLRWASVTWLALICGCATDDEDTRAKPNSLVDAGLERTFERAAADRAGAGTCELPGSLGAPECNDCLSTRCCREVDECNADAFCSSVLACLPGCTGSAMSMQCLSGCFAGEQPPAGFAAFDDCAFAECEIQCFN
jgi:hypothetical protein